MRARLACLFALAALLGGAGHAQAPPQENSLLPKYGTAPPGEAQRKAQREFVEAANLNSGGDLKRLSQELATQGWNLAGQARPDEAMQRFNQAWLLDKRNALALWGMAALMANKPGQAAAALPLYTEAQAAGAKEVNFQVDQAKAVGLAAVQTRNQAMLEDALARFARIHARVPGHSLNLQNWAVTLYYMGDYKQAWQKVALAEATPGGNVDKNFLAALRSRMPRP